MASPVRLTYAFDAYCGWCYGFAPALHEFAKENAERIDLRVLSGGLFSGAAAKPIGAYPHIPDANKRIAALTGVTFGRAYEEVLAEGVRVMDSTDAASGLVALRRQTSPLSAAAALQHAWYDDGLDLSDVEVYRSIATDLGLDASRVVAELTDPATGVEAQADFTELRRLGVDSYPTLLLHSDTGAHRLGGPVSSAAALTEGLDRHLAVTA
ncbi:DsbA family protein [Demequina aestuarii]|uniref:DsbA family protein n=1 Tax=Demequina aestuarii TaxID=327095 RepID=UPI0007827AFA|nr:DsbA family protein [Demequina aestuarii]